MVTKSASRLRDEALLFFRQSELPSSFEWFEHLTPLHQRLCSVELSDALKTATLSGDLEPLREAIEGWEATAELDAAPEVVAQIGRPKRYRPLQEFTA